MPPCSSIRPARVYELMSLTCPGCSGFRAGTISSPVERIETTGLLKTSISVIPSPASAPTSCALACVRLRERFAFFYIFSPLNYIFMGSNRSQHFQQLFRDDLRVLLHHRCIGAGREHAPCRYRAASPLLSLKSGAAPIFTSFLSVR